MKKITIEIPDDESEWLKAWRNYHAGGGSVRDNAILIGGSYYKNVGDGEETTFVKVIKNKERRNDKRNKDRRRVGLEMDTAKKSKDDNNKEREKK